jgi:tripartite-type tricarboxylate transporter receptor subunit TctC
MPKTAAFAIFALWSLASAFAQSPFYEGKTITIVQGREPGDAGDMRVKAVLPFMQKYIPGNPTIVSEYMPGGGGRKAANHV